MASPGQWFSVTSFSPFPSRAGEWRREGSAAGWVQPQHTTEKPKGPETLTKLPKTRASRGTSSLGWAQSRDCSSCSPSHTSSCCSSASGLLQSRELLQILPRQPEQMLLPALGMGRNSKWTAVPQTPRVPVEAGRGRNCSRGH